MRSVGKTVRTYVEFHANYKDANETTVDEHKEKAFAGDREPHHGGEDADRSYQPVLYDLLQRQRDVEALVQGLRDSERNLTQRLLEAAERIERLELAQEKTAAELKDANDNLKNANGNLRILQLSVVRMMDQRARSRVCWGITIAATAIFAATCAQGYFEYVSSLNGSPFSTSGYLVSLGARYLVELVGLVISVVTRRFDTPARKALRGHYLRELGLNEEGMPAETVRAALNAIPIE